MVTLLSTLTTLSVNHLIGVYRFIHLFPVASVFDCNVHLSLSRLQQLPSIVLILSNEL